MKKINWISSFPKSGNTYIRLFLSSYFYTVDGSRDDFQNIRNIISMNHYNIYKDLKNFPNLEELVKDPQKITNFWSGAQSTLSKEIKKNLFVKTHNCMSEINYSKFTNENFTKCFIYIVRDPRSVAISYKHHYDISYDKAVEQLINKNLIDFEFISKSKVPELISSWSVHYNSWKNFLVKGNGLIVRYEDLVKNPYATFKKILKFLKNHIDFNIDEKRLNQSIEANNIVNLQKIEKQQGFLEKPKKSAKFFRKGLINEWESFLTTEQQGTLESNFKKEMIELGYL